jgi:neutral amino acid transport system permease protein
VWMAVLAGLTAAAVFAVILGIPTLSLRGDYLAIVTIAAAEIARLTVRSSSLTAVTGGNSGIAGNDFKGSFQNLCPLPEGSWAIGPWQYSNCLSNSWWLRIVGWSLVVIAIVLVGRWMRSPWGRVLKGIREDQDAVRSLGKNVYGYKMQALVLGGLFGALGGMIYVLPSAVQADALGRTLTFNVWTILLLGGAATVFGPLLGSILMWTVLMFIKSTLRDLPFDIVTGTQAEAFSWVLVGTTLMLLVIFRPQGILGDRKEVAIDAR